jgi:RimJ/RimL family protein N-acetyltransferase
VARYQSWDAPVSEVDAVRQVAEFAAAEESTPGWFQYAVELRDGGILVGDVGVCLHNNRMQAELGFTMARPYQGRGYATEAVRCVLNRVFAAGVRRVSAECDARNTASARLLEGLGFRREGCRSQHTWIKGEWTDDPLFGLLADDWRGAAPAPHQQTIFACRPNLLVRDLPRACGSTPTCWGSGWAGAGPTRGVGFWPGTSRTSREPRWSSETTPTSSCPRSPARTPPGCTSTSTPPRRSTSCSRSGPGAERPSPSRRSCAPGECMRCGFTTQTTTSSE